MCEKCFVQMKTIPIENNFLLSEKFHFEFNQFEFFFVIFPQKILMLGEGGWGNRKKPSSESCKY